MGQIGIRESRQKKRVLKMALIIAAAFLEKLLIRTPQKNEERKGWIFVF
jgi:hypothetical protein